MFLDDAMGIFLFPKFPSNILGIYPFEISRNTQTSADMSRSDLHRILGGVPDDIPIRCVIFFLNQHRSHTMNCMKKLFEYYPSEVVITGGLNDKMCYDDRQTQGKKSSSNTCGIVLTGDTNHLIIKQVVLETHMQTREVIRDKLKQLKSTENKESFSFGIQISCVARGSEFYNDEQNVECSEFRNLFPNTPLIGIFGNGEIGHDYLPNSNQTSQQEINTQDLFLSYSTVFSLISLRM
jgi:F-box protein 22